MIKPDCSAKSLMEQTRKAASLSGIICMAVTLVL